MGNNLDKRSYRREFHDVFEHVIMHFERKHGATTYEVGKAHYDPDAAIQVVVRKRPLFQHEANKNEFDVIEMPEPGGVVVHVCKSHADLKPIHAYVETKILPFAKENLFDEKSDTATLYKNTVKPQIDGALIEGGGQKTTVFMYGQTGTGKTFTSSGIMKLFASDLFRTLEQLDHHNGAWTVKVACLELINDGIYDLNNNHTEVAIFSSDDVIIKGNFDKTVNNGQELLQAYVDASNLRETHATAINSNSSRSHYLFRVMVFHKSQKQEYARINVIDLAGSERNADSLLHDADRQREGAWINSSLMALKDVIRTVAENDRDGGNRRIPFRANKLTMLLKDSFMDNKCKTILIGTVSPNSTDTEHTLNTLMHLQMLTGGAADKENIPTFLTTVEETIAAVNALKDKQEPSLKPLLKWEYEDVKKWLLTANNGRFKKYVDFFPNTIDGKQLRGYTAQRFALITGNEQVANDMRENLQTYQEKCSAQKLGNAKNQREKMQGKATFF